MLQIAFATEPLLPGEVAPFFQHYHYTIETHQTTSNYTTAMLVVARHRLIIDIRTNHHERYNGSNETPAYY